ncbi:MAG: GNAT family N-acetyltransferase [Roseiflexus sp.]|nr:GNAT family N-acetyltransferase [Roseiflexus sp.]MCS7289699.1 GNAT family N-acetyltransferase [Roseiflexus sp.]
MATVLNDLGNGLVARWSTATDQERIAKLFSHVFRRSADDPPNERMIAYTRHLMSGQHPLIGPNDVALVEDTRSGMVVAATAVMRQRWEYAGIPFTLSRAEPVAAHEEYRNRGLVRATFDLMHARSAEQGDLAQCITGIPYFYRQFGYEFAVDLGGSRTVLLAAIPDAKEGQAEPFTLRDATLDDLPQIRMLYERERSRPAGGLPILVSAPFDHDYWRWTLTGQTAEAGEGWNTRMIARADGQTVGYVLTGRVRWSPEKVRILGMMVEPGVPLTAVVPPVLRALRTIAPTIPVVPRKEGEPRALVFILGASHPVYDALGQDLIAGSEPPYGWYVRVPDVPLFLRHIRAVLERRLAGSFLAGYSGELKIDFYKGGLRMVFEQGRIAFIEPWEAPIYGDEAGAGFPPLVFLQLLFGRRSLEELRAWHDDVWANDEPAMLLNILFPKQHSWVLPLD